MAYYCPTMKPEEEPCEEKAKINWKKILGVSSIALASGAIACIAKKNPPLLVGLVSLSFIGFTKYSENSHRFEKQEEVYKRALKPCTTVFDTYRFALPPGCHERPSEIVPIFYGNEPAKVVNTSWTEKFAYDNKPKPDCCKKKKEKKVAPVKETRGYESYGNLPPPGQCPQK